MVELELESEKREVNMKYQADFRFESNSISKEQSKPIDSNSKPLSIVHISSQSITFCASACSPKPGVFVTEPDEDIRSLKIQDPGELFEVVLRNSADTVVYTCSLQVVKELITNQTHIIIVKLFKN